MAFARDTYTATGGQTDFTITYPYQDQADVYVYQNGTLLTLTTDYTFNSATVIRLNSGATLNDAIILLRKTSQSTRDVDFTAGTLTEADLDNSAIQMFYMAQEALDIADTAMGLNSAGTKWDADTKAIINVVDPTTDQDAATKGYVDAAAVGTLGSPLSIANGGTSGATASAALAALGAIASADLIDLSGVTDAATARTNLGLTANGASLVTAANYAAMRALLDLEAGTDFVALTALLSSLAAVASTAAGDILYLTAADTVARLAAGSDGEVLTLASGVPSWAAANAGFQVISSGTVSASAASVDVAYTAADWLEVKLILQNIRPNTSTAIPSMRISTDGGSTYLSATNYKDNGYAFVTGAFAHSGASLGRIGLSSSSADGAGEGWWEITVIDPADTDRKPIFTRGWNGGPTNKEGVVGAVLYDVAGDVDGLQFLFDSGTIAEGQYILLGLPA